MATIQRTSSHLDQFWDLFARDWVFGMFENKFPVIIEMVNRKSAASLQFLTHRSTQLQAYVVGIWSRWKCFYRGWEKLQEMARISYQHTSLGAHLHYFVKQPVIVFVALEQDCARVHLIQAAPDAPYVQRLASLIAENNFWGPVVATHLHAA